MPKYTVAVDVITVHVVPVEADTPEAAQAQAGPLVEQDWETWYHHTEPVCAGDALTEDEWAAQESEWAPLKQTAEGRQAPPPARRPKDNTPAAKHHAPRTDHHADDTDCPPAHKHTSRNKPLTDGCPGRAYSKAVCTCGWTIQSPGKGYVNEERRRHLRTAR
ncbi:hypothetical protein ACIHEI_25540 [Kitasatospora sp. NPDC051984]|uniref:hypothetical protein n=1 Tax=Kitasatospora sp. NPDC051984 TaxID=3364059 RepID=UPI0037CA683B